MRNEETESSYRLFAGRVPENFLEETRTVALKEELALEVQRAMEKQNITKAEMAPRMRPESTFHQAFHDGC
jgi:hypothetical protein